MNAFIRMSALYARWALGFSFAILVAFTVVGCDSAPNTQNLPIGQRCTDDSMCGTSPYACQVTTYPGGYCDKSCGTDGDCPLDAVCASTRCRRKCTAPSECRETEGYTCRTIGATSPFCDVKLVP